MPLFHKQSPSAKKRLQHQQYLARESPEPVYDLSQCELTEIPTGTFSLCKVLNKTSLVLHHNRLKGLKGGGKISDISGIQALDLHDNDITSLPDDLHHLKYLQFLNLENNKIKHLPDSIGQFRFLQTLILKGNKLHDLPSSICELKSLRTLDIRDNPITRLPQQLCQIQSLESLLLDAERMQYPTADICSQGTEAIARFLCSECGMTYEPPSNFHADTTDGGHSSGSSAPTSPGYNVSPDHSMHYERMQERKRHQQSLLEKQLEEEQKAQDTLAEHAAKNKKHLLQFLAEDQERFDGELLSLQHRKEVEHRQMVEALRLAEQNTEELMAALVAMNERARKTEALLEKMERERMEAEQWFIVHQEELDNLRKQDIMRNMALMLEESSQMDDLVEKYLAGRDHTAREMQASAIEIDDRLNCVLNAKDEAQASLVNELLVNEEMQRDLFAALQLSKDTRHQRLSGQIEMIQQELMQLTTLEIEQREVRAQNKQDVLMDKRQQLIDLLQQLMKERDHRAEELQQRLMEMEQQKLDDQSDYWLVQYQRLMDRKPQAMMDMENKLEIIVVEILQKSRAAEYIPAFARHRISIETMLTLTDNDLKQMGVHELGLRKSILANIETHKLIQEEEEAAAKLKQLESPQDWKVIPPSPEVKESPSAPLEDSASGSKVVTARGLHSECVICMNDLSVVLFLGCGHVCCCGNCSQKVLECPLCRETIEQRIVLAVQS